MKFRLLIILLLLHITHYAQNNSKDSGAFHLKHIEIKGKTNIGKDFELTYKSNRGFSSKRKTSGSNKVTFYIPVKEFKAANYAMKKDFLEMMQASKYKNVKVRFNKNNISIINEKKIKEYDAQISLTLAGVTNLVRLEYKTKAGSNNRFLLKGNMKVQLSDFKLKQPKKIFGIITVKESVFIRFELYYTQH